MLYVHLSHINSWQIHIVMGLFSVFRAKNIPETYRGYAEACRNTALKKLPIAEARFVVLDTETTGLNPKADRILSIGAVGVRNFSLAANDAFEVNVKQHFEGNPSIAVHEITPGSAATANEPKVVMHDFLQFLGGDVIIGHYVDFDYKILSATCQRQLGFGLENKRYDTMQLLKRTDKHFGYERLTKPEDWGLDQICARYNLPISDRHTAMGDALATALIFIRQLKLLEKRGVKTVGELLRKSATPI